MGDTDKVGKYIEQCRVMGIRVEPPDVNVSAVRFSVAGDTVRFGLAAIRNVGEAAMESILRARAEAGPFTSLEDFCARVDLRLVNRRLLESLSKAGAFHSLRLTPAHLLTTADAALESGQRNQRYPADGPAPFFDPLTAAASAPSPTRRRRRASPRARRSWCGAGWTTARRDGSCSPTTSAISRRRSPRTAAATASPPASRTRAGSAWRSPRSGGTRSPRSVRSAPRIRDASRCSSTSFSGRRRSWSAAAEWPSTRVRSSAPRSSRSWAAARSRWSMPDALDFEEPLLELENRIAALQAEDDSPRGREEIAKLEERLHRQRQKTYASLTAWQRTQLARHPKRPHTRDFVRLLFEDFVELHGDRFYGDDAAIVGGLARFEGQGIVVIGHQKGRDTREKIARNFGMPHPEGYRKALRLMQLAAKFGKPVLSLIDTPGSYPGLGAEERGQAEAIARNLRQRAALRPPSLAVVTGEGGSAGALAIGMGNRVLILEYAIYSVISPEGCAAILWGDAAKAPEAAAAMRITAPDLLRLRVIDAIVPEPVGGAHRDWEGAAGHLREALREHLRRLQSKWPDALVVDRYEKFRRMGAFEEASVPGAGA